VDLTAWIEVIARVASLIGVSLVLVWLFRAFRLPGGRPTASIMAGVTAGLLLGPGVLGRASSPLYERVVIGADDERSAIAAMADRHAEARRALTLSGVSDIAVDELAAQQRAEMDAARAALAAAESARASAAAAVALGVFASAVLAAGLFGRRRRAGRDDDDPGAIVGVVGGVMGGLVAGLATAAIAHRLLGMDLRASIGLGGAIATGGLVAPIAMRWIPRCGRSRLASGLGAGLIAVGLAGVGFGAGLDGWGWWAPIALAWIAGRAVAGALGIERPPRAASRLVRGGILWIAAPLIAAEVAVRLEPGAVFHSGWVILALLVALIGCGDGHMGGMWLALKTHGRGLAETEPCLVSLETLLRSATVSSLSLTLALIGAGVIDPASTPGAAAAALVLVNAVSLELQIDWARPLARTMDGTMPESRG